MGRFERPRWKSLWVINVVIMRKTLQAMRIEMFKDDYIITTYEDTALHDLLNKFHLKIDHVTLLVTVCIRGD